MLTENSFHFFSFADQQRYRLCGNIQRRRSGILQHIWVNWCAILSIRLDERLDVVNFGRNVRLVQLHYCSSIKRMRAAYRAIEIYSSWAGKQLKWKRIAFHDATILNTLEHAQNGCDKFYRVRKQIWCNMYWKPRLHIRPIQIQSKWKLCAMLFYSSIQW